MSPQRLLIGNLNRGGCLSAGIVTSEREQHMTHQIKSLQAHFSRIRSFPRTLKERKNTNDSRNELQFKDERQKPRLGNLATHTKEHGGLIEQQEAERNAGQGQGGEVGRLASTKSSYTGFTLASARLMEKYVQDGLLNPRVEPTQSGFTRLFAAWLIEQDLPFTTGTFTISPFYLLTLVTGCIEQANLGPSTGSSSIFSADFPSPLTRLCARLWRRSLLTFMVQLFVKYMYVSLFYLYLTTLTLSRPLSRKLRTQVTHGLHPG